MSITPTRLDEIEQSAHAHVITLAEQRELVSGYREHTIRASAHHRGHTMHRFVKLDAAGAELPADATDHEIVRDTKTGLEWAARHLPDEHTHARALAACAAFDLADSQWRLPTREELVSIVDYDRFRPAIDTDVFPGCPSDWFWTASPVASDPDCAWLVYFSYGGVDGNGRNHPAWVRPVRGPRVPGQ